MANYISKITNFTNSTTYDIAAQVLNESHLTTQEAIDDFLEAKRLKAATFKTTDPNNIGMASNDGMLISVPWTSTAYGVQVAFDDNPSGVIKFRGKSTNWGEWKTIAHSGNVTTGDANGQVKIAGTNVSVKGLGSNAYSSTAYLPLTGGTLTGPLYVNSLSKEHFISIPDNGFWSADGSQTGAMKITLPVSWTATMMSMKVDIYNYDNDNAVTYTIGGYNYTGGDGYWTNCSASSTGLGNKANLTVRFGHDGTKCCIIIGETNTSWSYPKAQIRDIMIGHSGTTLASWTTGWTVSLITTLPDNINVTKSNPAIIPIIHGGTGASTAAAARTNLGTWSLISDSYNTLMPADGSTNGWVKIGTSNTSFGLLPSAAGGAGSGHNYLGTSSWYWKYAYIDEIHGTLKGNADTATKTGVASMWTYSENSNELNFGGTNNSSTIYIGYRAKDSKPIPTKFVFGGANGSADLQAKTVYLGSGTASYISASDYTGKSATATQLANARTIWGQSFNGTANISGNMIDMGPSVKLPSGQTTWQFLTSTGGAGNANFGRLGLNGTYANIDLTNYTLDVNGKTRINNELRVVNDGIWVQGGSNAGSNSSRMALTSGMPTGLHYNSSQRGVRIFSNAIAFADPYNGNSNNDSGWIRHIEETANTGLLEIATGDDGSNEQIVARQYNTSSAVVAEIKLLDGSHNSIMRTILPTATNTYTLGNGSYRWKNVHIGTADSYGSTTQPIYWNAGVPKAISYSLSATINAGTANRLAYYSGANAISKNDNLITSTAVTYGGRTLTPTLRVNNILYADNRIESGDYFLANKASAGASYYLYSNNVEYGRLWVNAIGVAGTATTYTNPNDETQTKTGYTGNVTGTVYLSLGNNKAAGSNGSNYSSPGTQGIANNARGYLRIYSDSSTYNDLSAYGSSAWLYPSAGLALPDNKIGIMFRPTSGSYHVHISHETSGNEALVAATQNSVTSFIFVNGESYANVASDRWTKLTGASGAGNAPGLQIKQNCVSIGELIPSGTNATYKLNVKGTQKINAGSLQIYPVGGNYNDGIRIHARSADNSWASITLCGSDNTGDTGTSANTWYIGANSGNFYIGKNGTGGSGTYLRNISNVWSWNGTADGSISGNAATATAISTTGGTTAKFWRGDNTWSNTLEGTLNLKPPSGSWVEGIRIHSASTGWATITLCGTDNTGDTGTSANSWSLHSYNGNFYLANNGSNTAGTRITGHNANGFSVHPRLAINADSNSSYNLYVNGNGNFVNNLTIGKTVIDSNIAINNTAFVNSISIFHNESAESSGETFTETKPSWGIGFQRQWSTGNTTGAAAGIYAVGVSGWRTGLAFRVKNNGTAAGGTHDITSMWLAPGGNVGIGSLSPTQKLHVSGGNLAITNNNNTVTIGSQNTSFTHVYNSANIPFILNNSLLTTTGNLGNTTYPFNNLYIGKAGAKGIYYVGTKATNQMITFLDNTSDTYGNGIKIGGGGAVVVGSGESAGSMSVTAGTENTYILADGQIYVEAGADTIANRIGFQVTNAGHVLPVKAEANNTYVQEIGATNARWKTAYIGAFTIGGGAADSIPSRTITSASTFYINRPANSSVIFQTDSTNKVWLDTTNSFRPETNNTLSIGTSSYKWANMYATTFHGALDGNASTATTLINARTINGTSFNGSSNIVTANWGTARNITIGGTTKSVNGSQAYTWTNNEINRIQIGSQLDHERVVIGLCELSAANTGIQSNWHGKIYRVRSNGLVPDYFADVDFNAAYSVANGFYYNLITDYENTSTTIHSGEGYHACVFKYNNKYYGGLEFKQTQASAFYANGVGDCTPFAIAYYNDNTSTVVNSEINDSLTFAATQCIRQQTNGSFKGPLDGNAATASSAAKLTTARTISLTGAVTGSASFDGSGNISIATTPSTASDNRYVLKVGDTMTGRLTILGNAAAQPLIIRGITGSDGNGAAGDLYLNASKEGNIYLGNTGTGVYVDSTNNKLWGAVWNDYAECRETKGYIEPGRCIREIGDDTLELTTERLQRGCEIVSDTFGFAIGQSEKAKTPTAASGRVLAYLYEDREIAKQKIGWPVCSGPNGTVSIMTEEEEEKYPSRIIGTISAVPDYDVWYGGSNGDTPINVNGRIWIRIR